MKMSTLGHYLMRSAALILILYGFFESGQLVNWLISKGLEVYRHQTETWDAFTLIDTIMYAWPCVMGLLFGAALWVQSRKISGIKPEEADSQEFHVHFRLIATIMISTLGLYMLAFGLILFADRLIPTILGYQDNLAQWADTPEHVRDPKREPQAFVLLSPLYQPLITCFFGLLLTELRRPLGKIVMPFSIEPTDELIESYHLFHRLVLTLLALMGFGFGLQWLGDALPGVYEFIKTAMDHITEAGMDYRLWGALTTSLYAPLTQMFLSVLLISLAKPISQWVKPYKAPKSKD